MKRKTLLHSFVVHNNRIKVFFRIMRISLLLLFICVCQLMAKDADAQNVEIRLSQRSMTIRQLVKEIEAQTDYLVVFRDQDVDVNQVVSFKERSAKVSDYLDETARNTNIGYRFDNNYITLIPQSKSSDQQRKKVSGKIVDANGDPIIGANVVEKGTTNGTVTDLEGRFTMEVPEKSTLIISYIGYTPHEISVNHQNHINVKLNEDMEVLEEVVVVGYGTQKKEVVTAAITTVKASDIAVSPSADVAAGLAGRLSGVIINTRSGEVGNEGTSIFVRGKSTYSGSSEPLYVVDGIARTEEDGILSRMDPNDIESISVLKDASAAIYGSRAANGVILITTKRGKEGLKPTINVSYNHSFAQPTRIVKMADAATYAIAHNWANIAKGLDPTYTEDDIRKFADGSDPLNYPNTDWYRTVQKKWTHQDKANISLRGGSEKVQYFMSSGFLNQGTPFNNGFTHNRQINIRSNLDAKINNYIKISLDLSAKKLGRVLPRDGSVNGGSMYSHVALNLPTILAKYPGTNFAAPARDGDNPLVQTSGEAGETKTDRWLFNSQVNVSIDLPWVKGLTLVGNFAYDFYHQKYKQFKNVAYVYNYDQATHTYTK